MNLEGKTILVGVTGGIAAYKTCEIVSHLRRSGASVRVVMTEAATRFVAPLTFRTLSGNPVAYDMFVEPDEWDVKHVSLAKAASLVLIAPATANLVGKLASGIADDLLTTTVMATRAPVLIVPAMNEAMYLNPIFQANKAKLEALGYFFMTPDTGHLACGDIGIGRMPDPDRILQEVEKVLSMGDRKDGILSGRTILVTAGPTREPIDPVRYISNRSSGKMGYALANASSEAGARVILVTGPVALPDPPGCQVVKVERAEEMYRAVLEYFGQSDCVVMAAAVADYTPADYAASKIKKTGGELTIRLSPTVDILRDLGARKKNQLLVGFAAETENVVEYAMRKLREKNLDIIVANDVSRRDSGFESDFNEVIMIFRDGSTISSGRMPKIYIARQIIAEIAKLLPEKEG